MKRYIAYTLVLALIAVACSSPKKAQNTNQPTTYKKDANSIHPQFVVFNTSDSTSELHFKVASKEVLYTRPDGINFTSNVLIAYRMYSGPDSKTIIDSGSVRIVDHNNALEDRSLIGKMQIKAYAPHSYYLRIRVADLNRNTEVTAVTTIEKDNDLNRQNFMVKAGSTDAPIFRSYVKTGEEISISYKKKMAVSLYVRYYNREFPLAAPPFSMAESKPFQYRADSTFVLPMTADGVARFTATKKGFYHIQLDTTRRDGLTLFNFTDAFPDIRRADDMILPLRFITSKQEYEDLQNNANKKAGIDKFWMDCTGNQDRAREMIRKYYNRVQDGNLYFTSYLEGWKTDRGMIYLIYGAPNVIYRTANSETWTYGEEGNINSLNFSFSKVNNPFTDNDFALERSAAYKQPWYMAVDIWRQGRAYLQD